MRNTEKQELRRKIKRLGLFFVIVFLPCMVISVLMSWKAVPIALNIFILVVALSILYFLFVFICGKMDKKKNERLSKKKDPFSD